MSRQHTGTKRSSILKQRAPKTQRLIFWVQRAGVVGGVLAFVFWIGSWLFLSGAADRLGGWTRESVLEMSAGAGFSVRNVLVEGREYTDSEALKAIVNVQKGDPLFAFNPKAAQEAVEKLSWVRSVHVERRLPDTVYLRLTERKPLALWQRKGKLSVIDEEGTVLTSYKLERFQDLIILVGEDAPVHAQALLEVLEVEPEIKEMVEAATFVSDRRWDLKLKTGVIVKLPEEELGLALRRLSFTHREEGLLKKDVRSIDLRDPNKITVRTHPGAVQEYKAGFNPAAGGDI